MASPTPPDGSPTESEKATRSLRDVRGHRQALEAAAAVAAAVGRRHEQGERAGPLSPDGVRIGPNGEAELPPADAAASESSAAEADSRADVHALGALLAELLGGRAGAAPRGAPASARRLVAESTDPDPRQRPPTAAAFRRRALEAAAGLAPSGDADEAPGRLRAPRPGRGRKGLAAAGIGALVVAGALAGVAWRHGADGFWARFHARTAAAHREQALDAQWKRAQRAYRAGRLQRATRAYQQFLRLGPKRARRATALRRLVRCHRRRGDAKGEIAAMKRFIEAFPDADAVSRFAERLLMLRTRSMARGGALHPLATDRAFTVDGETGDWERIPALLFDPPGDAREGGASHDLVAFYAVVADERLVMRFDTAGPVGTPSPAVCVAVVEGADAKGTPPWDWQLGFHADTEPWKWNLREGGKPDASGSQWRPLEAAQYAAGRTTIEVSVPVDAIGAPRRCALRPYAYRLDPWRAADGMQRRVRVDLAGELPRHWPGGGERLDYQFAAPPVME